MFDVSVQVHLVNVDDTVYTGYRVWNTQRLQGLLQFLDRKSVPLSVWTTLERPKVVKEQGFCNSWRSNLSQRNSSRETGKQETHITKTDFQT